jgi:uncharacterized protein (DUF488 family)
MMPVFFLAELYPGGYDGLFRALADNGVDVLIDVRLAQSSSSAEEALIKFNALNKRHIEYQWLKMFGNPYEDPDDAFRSIEGYQIYLVGMDKEIDDLYYRLMRQRCCIVDDVKKPRMPHRVALADTLKKKYGIEYADLAVAAELTEKYGRKEEE